jgi:hypothetical protein
MHTGSLLCIRPLLRLLLSQSLPSPPPYIPRTALTGMPRTGGCQEAYPPHSQAPACHRRCLPRRDQGAPHPAPRGPRRRPHRRHQGGQGEEGRVRVAEEGREGQVGRRWCPWPGQQAPVEAGLQGRCPQGPGKDPLKQRLSAFGEYVRGMTGVLADFRCDSVFLKLSLPINQRGNERDGMMVYIFLDRCVGFYPL